ncbi:hypothetical protein F5Y19DRAFT_212465 [Xylariaceae sp. FL1651]|nr:hypothetical protein F5Y19DRAFT_212465 [Xylariaceae sp. FL1651]
MPHVMSSSSRSTLQRTACDICRKHKLKCLRDNTHPDCLRCVRLHLRCEIAPARRPGRPRKDATKIDGDDEVDSSAAADAAEPASARYLPPQVESLPPVDGSRLPSDPPGCFPQLPTDNYYFRLTAALAGPQPWGIDFATIGNPSVPSTANLDLKNPFAASLSKDQCLQELLQLNRDFHIQWQAIQAMEGNVSFETFIGHLPPPFGDGLSIAEKCLMMALRFQQAIINLDWIMKHEPKLLGISPQQFSSISPDGIGSMMNRLLTISQVDESITSENEVSDNRASTDQPRMFLETPFVCLLVSCYVHTISLFEAMFVHIHRRNHNLDTDPVAHVDPNKGLQMGAFYIFSGRLQGQVIAVIVTYFLDNIERGLGLLPGIRDNSTFGLLSRPQHFELVQSELGSAGRESQRPQALRASVEACRRTLQSATMW